MRSWTENDLDSAGRVLLDQERDRRERADRQLTRANEQIVVLVKRLQLVHDYLDMHLSGDGLYLCSPRLCTQLSEMRDGIKDCLEKDLSHGS